MIQAVTFDLDGVYFPDGKEKFIQKLGEYGVSEPEARRVFLQSDMMNNQYKLGTISDTEFWNWAESEWKTGLSGDQLIQLLIDSYSVDEKVADIVKKVRKAGYKTLICSNNFPARIHGLQEKFGFLDDFDIAVFSYDVGVAKPSDVIFKQLVHQSSVPADSIVFADDNPEKLSGAQSIGIKCFVYENFNQFIYQLRRLGVNI